MAGPEYLQSNVGLESVEQPLRSHLQNIYEASAARRSMLLPPSPRRYQSTPPKPSSLQPEGRDPCGPDGSSSVGYVGIDPTTQVFQPPASISQALGTVDYESAVAQMVFGGIRQPDFSNMQSESSQAADPRSSDLKPRDTIALSDRHGKQHSGCSWEVGSEMDIRE
ncbi:unnamed protein product [Dibothriocephalus latus]|uniref:Uncharacterized protein n=1 Tax=Dibothriocephalus latus TaxID=60516 RepID=A0A3P7MCV9_DIBLA|nr:unnamed protein product [Dibothriocephalus latus]